MNKKSFRQRNAEIRAKHRKLAERKAMLKERRERKKRMMLAGENDPTEYDPETDTCIVDYKCLIAEKLENKEIEIEMRPLMEQGLIPEPLNSVVFCGNSGSGKTNAMLRWLLNPDFYKDFYNETYLFSLSGKIDPMFKMLNLKKENIISENILSKLNEIVSAHKKSIEEKGVVNHDIIHLIFEDTTGNFDLLKSPLMVTLMTMGRHLRLGVWVVCHKYKSLLPCLRLNASQILLFPTTNGERDQLVDDYSPPGVDKKDFQRLIKYAFKRTDDDKRPFFYIDNKHRFEERNFRKGLYEFLIPIDGKIKKIRAKPKKSNTI